MVQQKLTNINENANVNTVSDDNHISESVDAEINIISNSIPPVPLLREKRKRNQTVESSSSMKKKSI